MCDAKTVEILLEKNAKQIQKHMQEVTSTQELPALTTAAISCWKNLWASFSAIPTSGSEENVKEWDQNQTFVKNNGKLQKTQPPESQSCWT